MTTHPVRSSSPPVPPLESGDRLTRPEFERRYQADSEATKAELIEGVVYVASPLRFEHHAQPHNALSTWVGTYAALTPGTMAGIEPTVRLDLDNEVQPDIVLRLEEAVGGRSRLTEDGYLEGSPELIIEIAASSAAIDLGDKRQAYRRNGVREYLVWQSFERRLDWFHLSDGDYQRLLPEADGVIRSPEFLGLWLALAPLLNGEMAQVLAVLQQGLNSPAHQDFVKMLTETT